MWVVDHLADLESDFSVFHRVDDPLSLPGPEFFRKAFRLSAYSGVMAARVMAAQERSGSTTAGVSRPAEEEKHVPLSQMMAMHPDLIEGGPRDG
jgi:hypothetical protein